MPSRKRRVAAYLRDVFPHVCAFFIEVALHRRAESGVADEVSAVGGLGQVPPGNFVSALGAGLHPVEAAVDGKIDGLVVADFKVQEGVVFGAAPVAPIQRMRANEVERTGHVSDRRVCTAPAGCPPPSVR